MNKRIFISVLLLFSITQFVFAQNKSAFNNNGLPFEVNLELNHIDIPEKPDINRSLPEEFCFQVDDDSTELDSFILSIMDNYNIPGVSACIVKEGELFWANAYGWANFEQNIPVDTSTLFMLASVSKPFTGAALMQFYDQGLFELDDDINDYLPFSIVNPTYPDSAITFRTLLTHTSMIRDNWTVMDPLACVGDSPIPLLEFIPGYLVPGGEYYDPVYNFDPYPPGTNWDYTNVGFTLAGYLVEVLSGMTFEECCQENLFLPLEMYESSWFLANLDTNHIAMLYHWDGENHIPYGHMGRPWYPAGQLRSSAVQMARFLTAIMQYGQIGGTRILDSATVAEMTTIQYPEIAPSQGLIWFWTYFVERWIWSHGGSSWGTRTIISFCPDENTGVIVLTNGESLFGRDMIELALYQYAAGGSVVSPTPQKQPQMFTLYRPYPNPFNTSTVISFELRDASPVKLSVYDVMGREVQLAVSSWQLAGKHEIMWDASGQSSGVYFVRLTVAGGQSMVNKVMLIK